MTLMFSIKCIFSSLSVGSWDRFWLTVVSFQCSPNRHRVRLSPAHARAGVKSLVMACSGAAAWSQAAQLEQRSRAPHTRLLHTRSQPRALLLAISHAQVIIHTGPVSIHNTHF